LREDVKPSVAEMPAPSISVVVPTIGRPELLRALSSVRAQRTPARVELIVVYHGEAGTELPARPPAWRIKSSAEGRVGGCPAWNLGIAASDVRRLRCGAVVALRVRGRFVDWNENSRRLAERKTPAVSRPVIIGLAAVLPRRTIEQITVAIGGVQ
jgi:hypothetical protein